MTGVNAHEEGILFDEVTVVAVGMMVVATVGMMPCLKSVVCQ